MLKTGLFESDILPVNLKCGELSGGLLLGGSGQDRFRESKIGVNDSLNGVEVQISIHDLLKEGFTVRNSPMIKGMNNLLVKL